MIDYTPVDSLTDFKKKYGERGEKLEEMIATFILESSSAERVKIARQLGIAMADLESMLLHTK